MYVKTGHSVLLLLFISYLFPHVIFEVPQLIIRKLCHMIQNGCNLRKKLSQNLVFSPKIRGTKTVQNWAWFRESLDFGCKYFSDGANMTGAWTHQNQHIVRCTDFVIILHIVLCVICKMLKQSWFVRELSLHFIHWYCGKGAWAAIPPAP